jgi:hypothetical protein
VASDAEGSFSVDGVGSTYDVTLLPDTLWAYHYAGLTRRDPWFRIGSRSPVSNTATIAGKVPTAPGRATRVFITSDVSVTLEPGSGEVSSQDGTFFMRVYWAAPEATLEGTLFVLRWAAGADGSPTQYDAFASREVVLSHGSAVAEDFGPADLIDPPEAQIRGSVGVPTGYELNSVSTSLETRQGSFYLAVQWGDSLADLTFDFTVPNLTGVRFEVEAFAYRGGHHVFLSQHDILPPATGIILQIPEAPEIVMPAQDATDVDYSTVFHWTAGGGTGVYAVGIQQGYGGRFLALCLNGTTTRVPDLTAQGHGLRPGATHQWYVYKYFTFASLDEMVSRERPTETGDAHSETYSFTTRPTLLSVP